MIIYVHYKNNKAYQKCVQETMIQVNDEWVPAVLYYSMEDPTKYFVRSLEEFEQKFTRVDVPTRPTNTR